MASAEKIWSGGVHNCALLSGKGLKCWGNGYQTASASHGAHPGEMGDALPFLDLGAGLVPTELSAENHHTCALFEGGKVKCWGQNEVGQLGRGNTKSYWDDPADKGDGVPFLDLGQGARATALSVGYDYACALLEGGKVKCWGLNDRGQLGLGDTASRGDEPDEMGDNLPAVDLGSAAQAVAIAAGHDHTCALLEGGKVKCWGDNFFGELGLGDTNNRGDEPGEMGDNLPAVDLGSP